MVTEFKDGIPSADECGFMEHSRPARAKRVMEVGPAFAQHATEGRTANPIVGALTAASVTLDMEQKTAYRVMASVPFHFRLTVTVTGATAVVTDIYHPANVPLVVRSDPWTKLSAIKMAGGADGLIQLQPLA